MSRTVMGSDPHDHLVRHTLSVPEYAAGELRAVLPTALVERIDWATLRLEPGSFVDRDGESRTDLLFSVTIDGREARIYVLFEHQSTPDPDMSLRMLRYMLRIWRSIRETQRERGGRELLPVIVPVVLHHGASGWSAARSLGELLDWDEALREAVAAHVPDFTMRVDDLTRVPEVELLERDIAPLGKLVLWVLRAVRVGFEEALVQRWADELSRARREAPREAVLHVLQYLVSTDDGTEIFAALERSRLSAGAREDVMGLAQDWIKQGHAEGRAEGRVEGRAELLLRQLRLRFDDIPESVEGRVRAASVEQLDGWAERVLTAETLDAVFG